MEISSPDIDAYWCYLITFGVGIFVGVSKVNALMASSPGRWGFLGTWLVLAAYTAIPPLLFWFLDYTGVVHDTSLFGALIIAIGYRQILMGEMKSITVTGDISKLWSPFEAWAVRVRDHIVTVSKRRTDLFEEHLRDSLTQAPQNVDTLVEIAYLKTTDAEGRKKLEDDLRSISAETKPDDLTAEHFEKYKIRRKVDICLDAIRSAIPETWTHVLRDRDLIDAGKKAAWRGHWQSRTAITVMVCLLAVLLICGGLLFRFWARDTYYLWRFRKVNATEADRFRARHYLERQANKKTTNVERLLRPLTTALIYRDLDHHICEEILSMFVELHGKDTNFIPNLIMALHTEDSDLRLRINRTLTELRKLDYAQPAANDRFEKWVPAKNETAGDVERWVKEYKEWWKTKAPAEKAMSQKTPGSSPSPGASLGTAAHEGSTP